MNKDITQVINNVNSTGAHIFYHFHDEDCYINNAISYVTAALALGNHVMIIENDRILPKIQEKIDAQLTEDQSDRVHTMNNYDFYCYRGNFHKETILNYLTNMINPYLEKQISIQTWAHVEWRDQAEIFQTLGEYEQEADQMLQQTKLITICGYDATRVPETLKSILMDCHDYYMTDDSIVQIGRKIVTAEEK
jgi:hypothetical protein